MRGILLGLLPLGMLLVSSPSATTYHIKPDGTGDFPTIQAAIDQVAWGSVLELEDGTFTGAGNRDLRFHGKPITIRSRSDDPAGCVLDCQGSESDHHRGVAFDWGEGPHSVIQAITIANGYAGGTDGADPESNGGGVLIINGGSPTLIDVIIQDCIAMNGGGLMAWRAGSPDIMRCTFQRNTGWWGAGGGAYAMEGSPTFTDCVFAANVSYQAGAGISCHSNPNVVFAGCLFRENALNHDYGGYGAGLDLFGSHAELDHCTFIGNTIPASYTFGGGLCFSQDDVELDACTFYGNRAGYGSGIAVLYGSIQVRNTIIASGITSSAVYCEDAGPVTLSCSDLTDNAGGDWVGCIADQAGQDGNICLDPFFCDPTGGDLTLDASSPCAPENNPVCGQIGAWPVGCGATTVTEIPVSQTPAAGIRPNPTRGTCRIELRVPAEKDATVRLLDVSGRIVRELFRGSCPGSPGTVLQLIWDGRDDAGRKLPPGVYLARIETSAGIERKRVTLLK